MDFKMHRGGNRISKCKIKDFKTFLFKTMSEQSNHSRKLTLANLLAQINIKTHTNITNQ